jgi:dTMP kinase
MSATQAQGKFITFEGGEGTGKTTQIARLSERLRKYGIDAITTREPGGAPGADSIRSLLVSGATDKWDPVSEVLLLYAARRQHLKQTIRPALAQGAWVLCDRFADSTMAYQGYGHGISRSFIAALHSEVVGESEPDLTLILDIPIELGIARANTRNADTRSGEDRFERMDRGFHTRLRDGFLDIAAGAPERVTVIDADTTPDSVADAVWQAVSARFEFVKGTA